MLSLSELTGLDSSELRNLALHCECRFYATCMNQVACARDALAMGDRKLAASHLERAKTAWNRAREVEVDRVARCMADIELRGTECQTGVHRGIGAHVSVREVWESHGGRRVLAKSSRLV